MANSKTIQGSDNDGSSVDASVDSDKNIIRRRQR
jgi:hypothetical protein